jgi:hypothetical protein
MRLQDLLPGEVACGRIVVLAFAISLLGSCDERPGAHPLEPAQHRWEEVTKLDDTSTDVYFVVVDPRFAQDRRPYEDAADTLCKADVCQILFFATHNGVPHDTSVEELFDHGGWMDGHPIARFSSYRASGERILTWDCNFFPQTYLNDCMPRRSPSPQELKAAQKRGPLSGFGSANFGMDLYNLLAALGSNDSVQASYDSKGNPNFVKAKVAFHDRVYDATYDLSDQGLALIALVWDRHIDERRCILETKKVASFIEIDFGKESRIEYFDASKTALRYWWLFSNEATITVEDMITTAGDCTVYVRFKSKAWPVE